jgi:hypothetical protein
VRLDKEGEMKVKGVLVEGKDGHEYLLGFGWGPTGQTPVPTLSRRQADGTFEPLESTQEASKAVVAQLGLRGPRLIGPGWGKEFFLWGAFKEALTAFPPVPTWPTWSAPDQP